MSLKILDLDQICVSCPANDLKLSLTSRINVRIPDQLATLNGNDIVKALASGKVWASRGRGCRLDIQLSFNGRLLDGPDRLRIPESLGHHLRDAQLWSRLSLSPSLEIPQQDDFAKDVTDISLLLNRSTGFVVDTHPRGWLLDGEDVNPPDTVLCVEFERLRIHLEFFTIRKPIKRLKQSSETPGTIDLMLLDSFPVRREDTHSDELEDVVDKFKSLPAAVTSLFNDPKTIAESSLPPRRVSPTWFTREETNILRQWFAEHRDNPYPTSSEIHTLSQQVSLNRKQIYGWFTRARRRAKRTTTPLSSTNPKTTSQALDLDLEDPEDEMLLPFPTDAEYPNDEETMLFSPDPDPEEEMLFSQTPSLSSQPSTISILSLSSLKRPRTPTPTDNQSLHPEIATALTTHALQILLSGCPPRQKATTSTTPMTSKITTIKTPSTTLASLIPSVWSPGYKQIVAHHTRFLPIIERAVSGSWVRNAVGVGLRGVLGELASARVCDLDDHDDSNNKTAETNEVPKDNDSEDSSEEPKQGKSDSMTRLNAVVQNRLWSMMQRTLYDPKSAKRLRWDSGSAAAEELEGDVDLFASFASGGADDCDAKREGMGEVGIVEQGYIEEGNKGGVGGEEREQADDEGLLSYFDKEEWEAEEWEMGVSEDRDVEMETDEMLFGDGSRGGWDDEEDDLLFEIIPRESEPILEEAEEGELRDEMVGDVEEDVGMLI